MEAPYVAVLTSIVRPEEKAIFRALENQGVSFERFDYRKLSMAPRSEVGPHPKVVLNRSVSQTAGYHLLSYFEALGSICINSPRTIELCGNKALTSFALDKAGLPCPGWRVALDSETALRECEEMGFPIVLKPVTGSWGRLISLATDRNSAEAIVEHKTALSGAQNGVFYLQEYIRKPDRDLRVISILGEPVAAYARSSSHWRTNVKTGATTQSIPLTDEIRALSKVVSDTVGGGILSIDLLECPERGLLINEVNHTPEFKGAMDATGRDIASDIALSVRGLLE